MVAKRKKIETTARHESTVSLEWDVMRKGSWLLVRDLIAGPPSRLPLFLRNMRHDIVESIDIDVIDDIRARGSTD